MKFQNKTFLIFGLANKKSIAYGAAKALREEGANLIFSCQNERLAKRARPLAEELGASEVLLCDLERPREVASLFESIDKLDGIVHSVAYAPMDDLEGDFTETSLSGFLQAFHISVYSLIEISRHAKKILSPGSGIVTMTFSGSNRLMPSYKLMGPVKAALESSVRYLAGELGPQGIRVNAVSAGPIQTLAASAFGGVHETLNKVRSRSPLRENVDIHDVGAMCSFLLSSDAKKVTGGVHFVDSGLNILGE